MGKVSATTRAWKSVGVAVVLFTGLSACTTPPGSGQAFNTQELPTGASVQFRHDSGDWSLRYGDYFSAKSNGSISHIGFEQAWEPNNSSLGYVTDLAGSDLIVVNDEGNFVSNLGEWLPTGYTGTTIQFAPNGSTVAVRRLFSAPINGVSGHTTIYDGLTGTQLGEPIDFTGALTYANWSLAFSQDSTQVAAGVHDDVVVMPLLVGAQASVVATVGSGSCTDIEGWTAAERLVFLCKDGVAPNRGKDQLWSMASTGGTSRILDAGEARANDDFRFEITNRSAKVIPGTNDIVFTRADTVVTTFAPFSVGGQILAIVEDAPGAVVRPLTEVRPTIVDTVGFTSADVLISVDAS